MQRNWEKVEKSFGSPRSSYMLFDCIYRINLVSQKWEKRFIFDKVMGQTVPKTPIIPYMGISFLANRPEIFYGNSQDYCLSVGHVKSQFWALFDIFDFLGLTSPKMGVAHAHAYRSGVSKPNKRVDPLGGPFGYSIISKYCFRFFGGPTPLPLLRVL